MGISGYFIVQTFALPFNILLLIFLKHYSPLASNPVLSIPSGLWPLCASLFPVPSDHLQPYSFHQRSQYLL
jgi:hypothetical protein